MRAPPAWRRRCYFTVGFILVVVFLTGLLQNTGNLQQLGTWASVSSQGTQQVAWKGRNFSAKAFTNVARHSFASLSCALCDKEVLSNPPDNGPSIDIAPSCALEILNRTTLPPPDQLPAMDPIYGIDAVFVTHYSKLTERRTSMEQRVRDHFNVDPIFVTDFDREDLSSQDLECLSDREAQSKFIRRHNKLGEDSLTAKHMSIYLYMVRHSLQNVLVLEDDATFTQRDWKSNYSMWQTIQRDLPADYDMVFMSGCCNIHNRGEKISEHLYLSQQSRVASMYLVSNKGARNMLRTLPIVAVIDFHINYMAGYRNLTIGEPDPRVVDIKIYHTEPYMSDQRPADGRERSIMKDLDQLKPRKTHLKGSSQRHSIVVKASGKGGVNVNIIN